jgi:uncharacterized protein (TIGR03792 family)
MVIEWLQFRVPVADQARYVALDAEVWTACLAAHDGFVGKEVWCAVDDPEALNLVIRWQSMAHWKAVPQPALDAADAAFRAAMGAVYPVLGCVAYEVV